MTGGVASGGVATETGTVILIDDDPDVLRSCAQSLELAGLTVQSYERADQVLARLGPHTDWVVVSDIRMPGTDGMAMMLAALARDRDLPVVLITGHGDVTLAVEAMRCIGHVVTVLECCVL